MEQNLAIKVCNLSKVYRLYDKPSDRLKEVLTLGRKYHRDFYALQDISFEINKGESVGIIGRNGAGKSTLLKLLAGVLKPSSGSIEINGKVSALLELGLGFNPEMTGLENVYFGATIMGFAKKEIDKKIDHILEFADIGDFIHQPVKIYSSGMYVRLAFALQTAIDPDILIIDEAFAVGDIFFVAKCMKRIRQMQERGVTLLLASHDMSAIRALCQNAIFLRPSLSCVCGTAADVADLYIREAHLGKNAILAAELDGNSSNNYSMKAGDEKGNHTISNGKIVVSFDDPVPFAKGFSRYGDGGAEIKDVKFLNENFESIETLYLDQTYIIQVAVDFQKSFSGFVLGYSLRDSKGQMITGSLTSYQDEPLPSARKGERFIYQITGKNALGLPGIYTLTVALEIPVALNSQHIVLDVIENVAVFSVGTPAESKKRRYALVDIPVKFEYESMGIPTIQNDENKN